MEHNIMSNKTIVYFDPSLNGLGDCIVGCASAFVLSQVLEAEFKILNGKIRIFNFFNIPDSYRSDEIPNIPRLIYTVKNNVSCFDIEPADFSWNGISFQTMIEKLKNRAFIVRSCQNFGRLFFRDNSYSSFLTVPETEIIKHLFKHILIPHKRVQEKFEKLRSELQMENSTCVHIRCDDVWGDSNSKECRFNVDKTIERFIECFRQIGNPIILLTDHPERVDKIFKEKGVSYLTIPGEISHSFKSENVDYDKIVLDLLTIGECKDVVISYWSNFSRIGILRTLIKPWIVQVCRNINHIVDLFSFNLELKQSFRKAEPKELLSKER
jgi:hypothetical protein